MAVNYSPALKSQRMQAVITKIDAGASPGVIEIGTVNMAVVLASFVLARPSFSEASGIITLAGAPLTTTAIAPGTAASARIRDGGGTMQVQGLTVGLSGSDINLNAVALAMSQEVTIASGTITHA